jgi:glycosyltransferase involved in cell wall biosynthesis
MYHANLAVTMAAWFLKPRPATVWGIRGSLHDRAAFKRATRMLIRVGAWLSCCPDAIVFNSSAGAKMHRAAGYRIGRGVTISNGFDPGAWNASAAVRREVRSELGIGPEEPVVGSVGRYHHAKGSDLLFTMASRLRRSIDGVHIICVGRGMDPGNPQLPDSARLPRMHLLGNRDDVPRLLPALDVFVNPSRTEGFPNAVAEAMLSGLPCVATDVGDTRAILGDTGSVVPAADPLALAEAVLGWLRRTPEQRQHAGALARQRIVERYSQQRCTSSYEALYRRLAKAASGVS